VNLACAWILHARHEVDLNLRGAWMHVMGDALGSVAAILAAFACRSLAGTRRMRFSAS
jgi:Co/Zn/Cd efflux system component